MAGFRHAFPDLLYSGVFPSLPFRYRFSRSPTCLGIHARTGSVSPRAWPNFSSKEDLSTLTCLFTSLQACSARPFSAWAPTGDSRGTHSTPAAAAACVFNATMECSPSDWNKARLYPSIFRKLLKYFTAYVVGPFWSTNVAATDQVLESLITRMGFARSSSSPFAVMYV